MSSQTNPSPRNIIQTTPSPTNSEESSGGNSNTNVTKYDLVTLRVKDVVVDKDHLVTRIGPFDIHEVNLNNIRCFIILMEDTKRVMLLELISAARIEYDRAADRLLPKNASTKPSFITSDDTLFRIIHCNFDPSIREDMQKLGNSLCKDEIVRCIRK